jgi:plasmid stability protein
MIHAYMKRTLVQLDEETYRKLRQQAFPRERSISSLVREMVTKGLEGDPVRKKPTRVSVREVIFLDTSAITSAFWS